MTRDDEMRDEDRGAITGLLEAARAGRSGAADALFEAVYADLKRVASRLLAGQREHATLSTTVLVHEAYLRLVRPGNLAQQDRVHFFAVAARAMRQIVVDHARRRNAEKRGGGELAIELDEGRMGFAMQRPEEVLALDAALEKLGALDERLSRVIEWRFFAGMTFEEIAVAMDLSDRTLKRDWRKARAFLYRELYPGADPMGEHGAGSH
ncbi:MAG: ECF-type sigma factor [Thermoanaerobaculia bacterium]